MGGDTNQTRKLLLISLEVCRLPKADGSLGIRSPHKRNETFQIVILCKVLYNNYGGKTTLGFRI